MVGVEFPCQQKSLGELAAVVFVAAPSTSMKVFRLSIATEGGSTIPANADVLFRCWHGTAPMTIAANRNGNLPPNISMSPITFFRCQGMGDFMEDGVLDLRPRVDPDVRDRDRKSLFGVIAVTKVAFVVTDLERPSGEFVFLHHFDCIQNDVQLCRFQFVATGDGVGGLGVGEVWCGGVHNEREHTRCHRTHNHIFMFPKTFFYE